MGIRPLNIFYDEPDPDRWFPFDRYPRRYIRRLLRGPRQIRGQYMVFHNLIKGLDKLNYPYRLNDYKYIKKHSEEIACIIGKDNVLYDYKWHNPIIFGAAFGIHPLSNPTILQDYPIKKLLVPGDWLKEMFNPYGVNNIEVWPVGIDTEEWSPTIEKGKEAEIDFIIYNKIHWDHEMMENTLIKPIKNHLIEQGLSFRELKYGYYVHNDLKALLKVAKYAIYISEHETQGIAYQQILSSGIPILAWNRGGYWQDPDWYPHKIKFAPVSSVPYWDHNCGVQFESYENFEKALIDFLQKDKQNSFAPRSYILENLTLEKCAEKYIQIVNSVKNG